MMSRPDYAQGRYHGASEARNHDYDDRRQGSAWRGNRERSQSPVRRDRRDQKDVASEVDPYDEGVTRQTSSTQPSSSTYQPYSAPANERWEKGRNVQELQNPYGYAQAYAYPQPYANAPAHTEAQYQRQPYGGENAIGLPYDSATALAYQDPRYEGYSEQSYATGRSHDSRQNPQSRDVIFLGLEPTYTEEAVCTFDLSFVPSALRTASDARFSSDKVRCSCGQGDHRSRPFDGRLARIWVRFLFQSNRRRPVHSGSVSSMTSKISGSHRFSVIRTSLCRQCIQIIRG